MKEKEKFGLPLSHIQKRDYIWPHKPFSPTKGKDHVKTSIKLGNQ